MRSEFQQALRGVKQPLAIHHRVLMIVAAFVFLYLGLWVLHLLYAAKHYVFLAIALILLLVVVGARAGRLIRMAILAPPSSRVKESGQRI
jgi:Flp pilus assembly protein TadB